MTYHPRSTGPNRGMSPGVNDHSPKPEFDPVLVEQVAEAIALADDQWQHGVEGSRDMWERYLARAVLTAVAPTIYEEIMTDTFHPEFGFAWREPDGECYKAYQQGRAEGAADAAGRLRDLTSRLGFGDGITEPQADNDTVVAWFDGCRREADEWRESQRWREGCALAGHPDDEDCYEHDPQFAYQRGMVEGARQVADAVKKEADDWANDIGAVPGVNACRRVAREAVTRIEGGA